MDNAIYTDAMKAKGAADAQDFQERSAEMDGTAMYAEGEKIPDFQSAKAKMNMLQRKAGFICKSSAGRVVKLLQPYDSDIYTGEPEELPAQWGFKWSKNPKDALPFVKIATSPFNIDECCTENGRYFRSTHDNNVWSPSEYPTYWEEIDIDGNPIE